MKSRAVFSRSRQGHWKLAIAVALAMLPPGLLPALTPPLTAQTDSAGIPIITARAPLWGPGEGWTVSDEPVVRIGALAGVPEHQLNGVVGTVRLSGGDIVIGEWTTGELRRYDGDGNLVWRAAGEGEGPGEHAFLAFVGTLPGDSLVTFDHGLLRAQVFAPSGEAARTIRVEVPGPGFGPGDVIGISERHLILTFADQRGERPPPGVARWPGIAIVALSLDDGSMRTLMDLPGREVYMFREGGRVGNYIYRFGKGPRYAVSGGRLALADTERFSVRSIALGDGSTKWILGRDEPAREVTSEDVEAAVEVSMSLTRGVEGMPEGAREGLRRNMSQSPTASTLPVLQSLHLDAVGNLWVEPYSLPGTDLPPFQVYSPYGTWLGTIAMPAGLSLEPPSALRLGTGLKSGFEIGDDYILGVWRDELDVEYVRLYALEKQGRPSGLR